MKTKINPIFFNVFQRKPGEYLRDCILLILNCGGTSLTLCQMEFFDAIFVRGSLFNVLAQAVYVVLILVI